MAIVIEFPKEAATSVDGAAPKQDDRPLVKEDKLPWEQCKHRRCVVSEEQRTVTCKDCKATVDPVAYILLLYGHYQTRVDSRLAEIHEYERHEKNRAVRRVRRERAPRRARIERRAETAERAAYNEYQAKVLQARAERQRQLVERLDGEIAALPSDPVEADVELQTRR